MTPLPPESEIGRLPDVDVDAAVAEAVTNSLKPVALQMATRTQLMDLLDVPRGTIDRSAYAWSEMGLGLKTHLLAEDPARGVKKYLVWGKPGAATPRHDHLGDEVILVLEGRLKDDRASYGPGDICRSKAGDIHQEQVEGDVDCLCFVVYYGDWVPV